MSGEGLALVGPLALERFAARGWEPRFVGGLTLGADPVAYAIAAAARASGRTLDAFTVRKQPKPHGAARRIEGCFAAGAPGGIVEGVITPGGAAQEAVPAGESGGGRGPGGRAVGGRGGGGGPA